MKKVGYYNGKIETLDSAKVLANPEITERLEKFAFDAKRIAPKSDDFLYFSIIFLKAAESALIDDEGNLKKVGRDSAWGYFDDNWRWHGNVKPHKNNNSDIFGEKELKKAYKKWIGAPLCVDHKSDSVDGIRGIILDAHYDEKLKQVVGLCALDKVNYPELARKVETGVVRYGSMGTAVETSICTECGNRAKVASDYCSHVTGRTAWGEINVGLKPIEYSLVVQPAEPGAKLLKCIASLEEHEPEIKNYGVDDFSEILEQLSDVQAYQLEAIVKKACGEFGCSLDERRNLIVGFLAQNGFSKNAQDQSEVLLSTLEKKFQETSEKIAKLHTASSSLSEEAKKESMQYLNNELTDVSRKINELKKKDSQISRNQAPEHRPQVDESPNEISQQIQNIPATSGLATHFQDAIEPSPSAGATADGEKTFSAPVPSGGVELNDGSKYANVKTEKMTKFSDVEFKSIVEDIMNESRLRKRAELRRRLAYHQGGSEGVEPKTFKSEPASKHQDEDKQMHQDKSMGGDKGMFPGDLQAKEKLKRASERTALLRATAYHQGGSEGVEPKTFKSEPASKHQGEDKQMHQDKSMGGDKGMFPGDAEAKKKVSRAAYNGPALRTKFVQARNADGSLNKSASTFKVFAGDKLVINATAEEIYGDELDANWDFITSPEYGKEVVSEIRTAGLAHVAGLLKSAQELPEAPAAAPAAPAPMPAPEMEAPEAAAPAHSPKQEIEDRLMDMEDNIEDLRELMGQLSDGKEVNVDINVGGEEAEQSNAEKLSLSSTVLRQLKLSLAQMDEAADELAMIAETHEGIHNLSPSQQNDLHHLTNDAISDSIKLAGEASALKKIARTLAASIVRTAEYVEPVVAVETESTDSETETLIAEAMVLRRNRRNAMLKKAQQNVAHEAHDMEHDADDKKKETLEGNKVTIEAPKGEEVKVTVHHAEADKKEEKEEEKKEEKKEDKKENDAMDAPATETYGSSSHTAAQKLVASKLSDAVMAKKASEEREAYRLKVRRAYDVGMEMQRKGLVANTKTALDRQVDEIMDFDDKAFEAFKRTIANAKAVEQVKTASDLSGLNVGVESTEAVSSEVRSFAGKLSSLWDKK